MPQPEVFRTPDERFAGLPGFPFAAHSRIGARIAEWLRSRPSR